MSSRRRSKQPISGVKNIAAIDVGTNSVHMIIAKASSAGFEIITSSKEMVRLGTGGGDSLSLAAMDRALGALEKMKDVADVHKADVHAVATSAVREASNASDFIERVKAETGINVHIVSGPEEARLIFLGVSKRLMLRDDSVLMIDIGGGSTELSLSRNGHLEFAQSLKLGAVRLTEMFLKSAELDQQSIDRLIRHVRARVSLVAHDVKNFDFDRVVVSSGTCETIARMASLARGNQNSASLNGVPFSGEEVRTVTQRILECGTSKERASLQGLDPKRSDIIVAGALILREIVRMLKIKSLEYCDYSLREGVLFDAMSKTFGVAQSEIDASFDSVVRLAQRCSVDLIRSAHVTDLALQILRQLCEIYDLDEIDERILIAASYLANSGASISYSKHHLHSYYIIRNADLLGFNDDEIEMIALIARYHRKSTPKQTHPEFARLNDEQRFQIELLAGILRIATALDRSHDQCVSRIKVIPDRGIKRDRNSAVGKKKFQLTFRIGTYDGASNEAIELNIDSARENSQMLADTLGDELLFS